MSKRFDVYTDKEQAITAINKLLSVMLPKDIIKFDFTLAAHPGNYYNSHATIVVPDGTREKNNFVGIENIKTEILNDLAKKIRQYLGIHIYFTKGTIIEESELESTKL
jgi:hypothetical protein